MDARPKTRRVNRERKSPPPQAPRGAKQIVIPMSRPQYDDLWHRPDRLRAFLAEWAEAAPELFPAGFDRGYDLHGFGRESRKLPGVSCGRSSWPTAPPSGSAPASSPAT